MNQHIREPACQNDCEESKMPNKNSKKQQQLQYNFNQDDVYGVFKQEIEVDTDVNEDANRERLLDESVDNFLDTLK